MMEFVYIVVLDVDYEGVHCGTVFLEEQKAADYADKMNGKLDLDLADAYRYKVYKMPFGQSVNFS